MHYLLFSLWFHMCMIWEKTQYVMFAHNVSEISTETETMNEHAPLTAGISERIRKTLDISNQL